jgi:flagellin
MSLGVLNNLSAIYAQNNLSNTNNSLSKTLQQLSSGSRINSGADDAAGLSLVNGLQANQTALSQSETNATEGVGLLQVADGALSQVTSLLNRAVTLATEASNGTLNSSQDAAANQEYQSILNEVSNIGSTTTYNQQQVFGTNKSIYTGDSTQTGASVDSLNISGLSSSNLGDTSGSVHYTAGAASSSTSYSFGSGATQATDITSVGGTTTTGATGTINYKDASGTQKSFNYTTTDAAASESLSQLATDISAGGTAAGISATVNSSGVLTLTAGTSGATAISIASGKSILANGASASGTSATTTYAALGASATTALTTVGGVDVTASNATGIVSYTDAYGASKSFTYNITAGAPTLTDLKNAIDAGGTGAGISATVDASGNFTLSAGSSGATNLQMSTVVATGTANTGTDTPTQDNPTVVSAGVATISYTASAGQSLSSTDLSNQTDSQKALTALNSAIADVAAQDGYIGAQINTLNAVSSVLSTQAENVTAAQNAVQATDYASATSAMSKYEILSQTGISALAQANSVQQEVTKLLQ